MSKIILCRHGHVEGISPARFRGRAEIPLTERGIAEAQALGERIAAQWSPTAIYVSPLQRCMQTGDAVARTTGAPLAPLDALLDIDYGDWQRKAHDEAAREFPAHFSTWRNLPWLMRFPNGECLQDLLLRTADVLRFVLDRHTEQTVVLVGHESVNRAMLLQVMDRPLTQYWRIQQAPCTLNEFEVTANSVRILRIDDSSHLSGFGSPP
jgi:phosphoserine phosphatase